MSDDARILGEADADGAGYRTICRRAERDRAFLAAVRAARDAGDLAALYALEAHVLHELRAAERRGRAGPGWRAVVIARALRAAQRAIDSGASGTGAAAAG